MDHSNTACTLYPHNKENKERTSNEYKYLTLVHDILTEGVHLDDRTGTGTISNFGMMRKYVLEDGFPLMTTKKMWFHHIAHELLWFLRGSTNANELKAVKVNIWNANTSRATLDKLGLKEYEEGDIGPGYGFQWRHAGAEYKGMDHDYTGEGVDQIKEIIDTIERIKANGTDPGARRMILNAWHAPDIKKMALPPCHMTSQFYVADGVLSCSLHQRSGDTGVGIPYNIASYALLLEIMANITGLKAGTFTHFIGDAHIYLDHIDALKEQLTRTPNSAPRLVIKRKIESIDSISIEDLELVGYEPQEAIPMKMSV